MGSATAYQAEKYDVVLIALVMFHRMDGSNVGLLPLQLQQTINCPLRTEMKIHLHLLDIRQPSSNSAGNEVGPHRLLQIMEQQSAKKEGEECGICAYAFTNLIALPCHHKLCPKCLGGVQMTEDGKSCPLCKKENSLITELKCTQKVMSAMEANGVDENSEEYMGHKSHMEKLEQELIFLNPRYELPGVWGPIWGAAETFDYYAAGDKNFVVLPNYIQQAIGVNDIQKVLNWLGPPPVDKRRLNAGEPDLMDFTMVFCAALGQNSDLLSILLQLGADVNQVAADGTTALIPSSLAPDHECIAQARLLLEWGAEFPEDCTSEWKDDFILNVLEEGNAKLASLLTSEFGGRRCEVINLPSRPDLIGKTCVVEKYLPNKGRYKVVFEASKEVGLLGPQNLKRRDRTPYDCGYYINYKNGKINRHEFASKEECKAFVASLTKTANMSGCDDPEAKARAEETAASLLDESAVDSSAADKKSKKGKKKAKKKKKASSEERNNASTTLCLPPPGLDSLGLSKFVRLTTPQNRHDESELGEVNGEGKEGDSAVEADDSGENTGRQQEVAKEDSRRGHRADEAEAYSKQEQGGNKVKDLDALIELHKGDESKIQAEITDWWEEPQIEEETQWESVGKSNKKATAEKKDRGGSGGGFRHDRDWGGGGMSGGGRRGERPDGGGGGRDSGPPHKATNAALLASSKKARSARNAAMDDNNAAEEDYESTKVELEELRTAMRKMKEETGEETRRLKETISRQERTINAMKNAQGGRGGGRAGSSSGRPAVDRSGGVAGNATLSAQQQPQAWGSKSLGSGNAGQLERAPNKSASSAANSYATKKGEKGGWANSESNASDSGKGSGAKVQNNAWPKPHSSLQKAASNATPWAKTSPNETKRTITDDSSFPKVGEGCNKNQSAASKQTPQSLKQVSAVDTDVSSPPHMGAPGPHGYNMYWYPQPSPHAHHHQQAYWPSPTGSPPYQQGPYGQPYGYYPYPPHQQMMMMQGQQGGPPHQQMMMMRGQQGGPPHQMMMSGQQGGPMMMPGPNGGYYFAPPYHQPPVNGYPQQYPLQAPTAEPQDGQAGPPGADGGQDGPPGENGGQVGPPLGENGGQDGPPGPKGVPTGAPTTPSDAANDAEKLKEAEQVAPEADAANKDTEEPKVEPVAPAAEGTKDTEESDGKKPAEQGESVTV